MQFNLSQTTLIQTAITLTNTIEQNMLYTIWVDDELNQLTYLKMGQSKTFNLGDLDSESKIFVHEEKGRAGKTYIIK